MSKKEELPDRKTRASQNDNLAASKSRVGLPNEDAVQQYFGWEGPLPPPQLLGKYSDQVKDGAERVFPQFELEAEHRREMVRRTLDVQSTDLMIGKILAFVFVMGMIGTAIFAISKGYPVLAGVLGTTVLGTVVWAFVRVTGETEQEQKRPDKRRRVSS